MRKVESKTAQWWRFQTDCFSSWSNLSAYRWRRTVGTTRGTSNKLLRRGKLGMGGSRTARGSDRRSCRLSSSSPSIADRTAWICRCRIYWMELASPGERMEPWRRRWKCRNSCWKSSGTCAISSWWKTTAPDEWSTTLSARCSKYSPTSTFPCWTRACRCHLDRFSIFLDEFSDR